MRALKNRIFGKKCYHMIRLNRSYFVANDRTQKNADDVFVKNSFEDDYRSEIFLWPNEQYTKSQKDFIFQLLVTPKSCSSPSRDWLYRTTTTARRVFHGKGLTLALFSSLFSLPAPLPPVQSSRP